MRNQVSSFGDFRCAHCHSLVSGTHLLSGVNHRNHCPYCLWSRHVDLFAAGDRLSACKGHMQPIGLTVKKSRNKYRLEAPGELMLIHECLECASLSINRIAADDDPESILEVFRISFLLGCRIRAEFERQGIAILNREHAETVNLQLYGQQADAPALDWR
jgi:hypothetical protein